MKAYFAALLGALLWLPLSFAQDYIESGRFDHELRFGAEWTFFNQFLYETYPVGGNQILLETPLARGYVIQLAQNLERQFEVLDPSERPQITLQETKVNGLNRLVGTVRYPDHFEFRFFGDPGVLEVNTSPSTTYDIQYRENIIDEHLFRPMAKLGLVPTLFAGAGHMHLEVSRVHPVTIRNFMVDFFNHAGIAQGGLNDDLYNAVSVVELPEANQRELMVALERFDQDPFHPRAITQLFEHILAHVYYVPLDQDLPDFQKLRTSARKTKNHALNLMSYFEMGTLEIRSIRPQQTVRSYLKLQRLFVARMEYAQRMAYQGKLIPLAPLINLRGNAQAVLASFHRYVTEVGLDFEDYREFVLPWWQNEGGEFDQFMAAQKEKSNKASAAKNQKSKVAKVKGSCRAKLKRNLSEGHP